MNCLNLGTKQNRDQTSCIQRLFLYFDLHGCSCPAPVKFGKIFAMVIADIGSSRVIGNNKEWLAIEFRHFKGIHIVKANAFDPADGEILLYKEEKDEEGISNSKAQTHNLKGGKTVQSNSDARNSVIKTARNSK